MAGLTIYTSKPREARNLKVDPYNRYGKKYHSHHIMLILNHHCVARNLRKRCNPDIANLFGVLLLLPKIKILINIISRI